MTTMKSIIFQPFLFEGSKLKLEAWKLWDKVYSTGSLMLLLKKSKSYKISQLYYVFRIQSMTGCLLRWKNGNLGNNRQQQKMEILDLFFGISWILVDLEFEIWAESWMNI